MIIQNNLNALNILNNLNNSVSGVRKATERLSSGLRINRASDDAAGLAISEKMRSLIRGLNQAIRNANDGISLLQTAEGGLNETHAILQRIRELAVQASNGTYRDELDRQAMQKEVDALIDEINRISGSTEYNKIKLLNGEAGGSASQGTSSAYGALYGVRYFSTDFNQFVNISSSIEGAAIEFTTNASGRGGENAFFGADGKTLTINLAAGLSYTDSQINDLIKNAKVSEGANQIAAPPKIEWRTDAGIITATNNTTQSTVAGTRQKFEVDLSPLQLVGGIDGHANKMKLTANQYGSHTVTAGLVSAFRIVTDVGRGQEKVSIDTHANPGTAGAALTLHLATGTEYTNLDIENLLRKAGFDYSVELYDDTAPDGFKTAYFTQTGIVNAAGGGGGINDGLGLGKGLSRKSGDGIVFQIGANGEADQRMTVYIEDMSAGALGVSNLNISTREAANNAINIVDKAISMVSLQRAGIGAAQNRLEHTINSLTVASENMTSAESRIRDADMAAEMIKYTKYALLQQVAQALLVQANQAPQAVLQLLQ